MLHLANREVAGGDRQAGQVEGQQRGAAPRTEYGLHQLDGYAAPASPRVIGALHRDAAVREGEVGKVWVGKQDALQELRRGRRDLGTTQVEGHCAADEG